MLATIKYAALAIIFFLSLACATSTTYVRPDQVTELDTTFSDTDLKMMAEKMASSILELPAIKQKATQPKIAIMNIENRTFQHIDTAGITEKILVSLLKSGLIRFVDRTTLIEMANEKNLAEKQALSDQEAAELGKLIGADFFMLGGIMSIEKRTGIKDIAYYKLTLRLVDVQTSEIIWADEKEIKKATTKGYLDWQP
jgi:uncharacterized protein (TIGR02722 family)